MNKLLGRTILNTRPLERALPLAKAIEAEGGQCLNLPSFSVVAIPVVFLPEYLNADIWFFMSQYAVKYALPWLLEQKKIEKKMPKIAAVGRKTAMILEQSGIPVTGVPDDFSSEGLLNLPEFYIQNKKIKNNQVIVFRGKSGRKFLDQQLIDLGVSVTECLLYERIIPVWTQEEYAIVQNNLKQKKIDLALGMSIESLIYFFSRVELTDKESFFNIPWLVMSQRVAEQAKKMGIKIVYIVNNGDIFESLIECFS